MRIYKLLNKSKIAGLWILILLTLAILLIFPSQCRNGATNGVFLCLQVLIPSLFPFMILSSFISKSGIATHLPKFLTRLASRTFGLPDCALTIILLSLVGGYPVGAQTIKEMYKQKMLTKAQAERMSMFCVASGPGFLLTYIGAVMTRNLRLGYILLVSQILSTVLLGLTARFTINPSETYRTESQLNTVKFNIKEALVYSVESAIKSSTSMCALVVIFSSISEIFCSLCVKKSFLWLTSLIEITNGIKNLADSYPAPLISFACGFGGLCVHFQIFTQLSEIKINKCNFYIFRISQGLICAGLTAILTKIFPLTKEVFSTINAGKTEFYTTSIGCVCLILLCVSFIICIRPKRI